jgi:hypothetical protein
MTIGKFIESFQAARRAGTPIIAIETPDPAATVLLLREKAFAIDTPVIEWDSVRGWKGAGQAGIDAVKAMMATPQGQLDPADVTFMPMDCLRMAQNLPGAPDPMRGGAVLFMYGANRLMSDPSHIQGIWNLRDPYKGSLRTLVLLGPSFRLPAELANDVLLLDEPLPDDSELKRIVLELCAAYEPPIALPEGGSDRAVDALRGLAAFPAEQAAAMSLDGTLDIDGLWERKRKMIGDTPGLSVWAGSEKLDDIGGNEQIKKFIRLMLAGRESPRVIVFIDEIEKSMAGAIGSIGDSSGVSQRQHQQMLTYMEDTQATGMICVGPPGCGKSFIAKAVGGEAGLLTIVFDLGGTMNSLVGETEARMRAALKVITAVGGGRAMFIATCNREAALPPELKRRFTLGTFYFDLPDAAERDAIWNIHATRYELNYQRPDDNGWTGAEIKQCCLLSYRLNIPLTEAAAFIVPVRTSAAEQIAELRRQANGRFLSAAYPGRYVMPVEDEVEMPKVTTTVRRMTAKGAI